MLIEGAGLYFYIRGRQMDLESHTKHWGGDEARVQASMMQLIGAMFFIGGSVMVWLGVMQWPG